MIVQLARRLVVFLLSLLVASVAVFLFMAVLPGDPARVALGVNASDAAVAALRSEFGIDRPLPTQYLDWVGGLRCGDFGRSYVTHTAIGPQVLDRFMVTAWLVLSGMVIALVVAVPLGVLAAIRHRRPQRRDHLRRSARSASRCRASSPASCW